MAFKKNVGILDAILRLTSGAAVAFVGFSYTDFVSDNVSSTLLGIFGLIFFITGVVQNCPLYNLIGFNSCKID